MRTIDDVSRLANVSRATVSRVLTGKRGVREESREAVLRAVEELNYRPRFAVQNLASQSSSYIGVVLSSRDVSRGARLLPALARAMKLLNKTLIVQYVDNAIEHASSVDDLLRQCSAVVVFGPIAPGSADNVISFDRQVVGAKSQGYDFTFAAESACRYMISKGHRNIALVIDNDTDDTSKQIVEGYRNMLQNFSFPFNRLLVLTANEDVEHELLTLINSMSKFTAILVKRDSYAAEAMRLFREFNISVPHEVSLLSLEDSSLATQLYPQLTCISWPMAHLLNQCVQRIKSLVEGRPLRETELQPIIGKLTPRQSVMEVS
ncbi:TPA: LacI family DNA-binding transcriptional regulator [Escherichia coli]|nr:LacI family DNA-binding transcriptional regulator [Escherichia coli]HCQ3786791.1 LacI family DNA-binding transcriptional regulator [Escherichia coli]